MVIEDTSADTVERMPARIERSWDGLQDAVFDEIDAVRSGGDVKRAGMISKLVSTAQNGVKIKLEAEKFARQLQNGNPEDTAKKLLSVSTSKT